MKNKIEFFRNCFLQNIKKCQELIQAYSITDPILCLRLLYLINQDEESNVDKVSSKSQENMNYLD